MIIWTIAPDEESVGAYSADTERDNLFRMCGIAPDATRRIFDSHKVEIPLKFILIKPGGLALADSYMQTTDFMVWSWFCIFSLRAYQLLVQLGCKDCQFLECVFESNPNERHFAYLPRESYDVIDYVHSEFAITIPLNPPVPSGIKKLVLKGGDIPLPPCFYASIPGSEQVLGNILVLDNFKKLWIEQNYSGAMFQKIM